MKRLFVLENKKGEVVRQIRLETDEADLVFLSDLRRVEIVNDLKQLDEDKIAYTKIAHISSSSRTKKIAVGEFGFLRMSSDEDVMSSSLELPQDDEAQIKESLKWTGGLAVALMLFLVIGMLISKTPDRITQEVVVVPKQEKIEPTPKEKKVAVAPNQHKTEHKDKVVQHVHKKAQIAKQIQVNAPKSKSRIVLRAKQPALNSMGALAVLGSMKNSKDMGGIKVSSSQSTRGVGLGGNAGSGGMQTMFYGKGLSSAALGPGARAEGGGGYGSHGKGGGQAGYGKQSLVGASGGYYQPVVSEADVEGGLDQSEIDQVIQRHQGEIRFCYEQGLQATSNLSGRVTVHFIIGGVGHVNEADVAGTSMHSSPVENCVLAKLKSWKFPSPRNGVLVKVNYPFNFRRMSHT